MRNIARDTELFQKGAEENNVTDILSLHMFMAMMMTDELTHTYIQTC